MRFSYVSLDIIPWKLDPRKGERTVAADGLFQVADFSQGGILAASAQEIAQRVQGDSAVAALVEERECFFVVCGGLVVVRHFVVYLFNVSKKRKKITRSRACDENVATDQEVGGIIGFKQWESGLIMCRTSEE